MNESSIARILYLTPGCFDKGGISRYCRYQIAALRELFGDSSVRVLSLLGPDPGGFEEPFDVTWHGAGNGSREKLAFAMKMLRHAADWHPSVIHCAHVNFSGLARFGAKIGKSKTVLNTYGLEVWSGLRFDAGFGLRGAGDVIADCHFTAEYLESEGLRDFGTTDVIWDCVDLDRFKPGRPDPAVLEKYGIPLSPEAFVVMTLGRLSFAAKHKGYERLLDVFQALLTNKSSAKLVIAGKGDMMNNLRLRAAELGIGKNVIFPGPIDEEDLCDVYRSASVFTLVSDRGPGGGEGIPLTPLEAMACSVPIVVGSHDGSQEAVEKGVNGYIVDPFDRAAHLEVLLRIGTDKELREKLAIGGRTIAEQRFSYRHFIDKHKRFYSRFGVAN